MAQLEEIALAGAGKGRKTAWATGLIVAAVHTLAGAGGESDDMGARLTEPLARFPGSLATGSLEFLLPAAAAVLFHFFVMRITGRRWISVLGTVALFLNPAVLTIPPLSGPFIVLLLMSGYLAATQLKRPGFAFGGLAAGGIAAVVPPALLLLPVLYAVFVVWSQGSASGESNVQEPGNRARTWVLACLGGVVSGTLAFVVRYDSGLINSVTSSAVESASVFSSSTLFDPDGWRLWARPTTEWPFPPLLLIPLSLVKNYGLLASATILLGISPAWHTRKFQAASLVALIVSAFAVLVLFHSNRLMYSSIVVLTLPGLTFFLITGIDRIVSLQNLKRSLVFVFVAILVLVSVQQMCKFIKFPITVRHNSTISNTLNLESLNMKDRVNNLTLTFDKDSLTSPGVLPRF